MKILGLSAFYHDSAAALVIDGKIIAAAQEERFTRKKHDHNFPKNAVKYCLATGRLTEKDLDVVVFYDKPMLKFERLIETYLMHAPRGFKSYMMAMPLWLKEKLFMERTIRDEIGFEGEILYPQHHESHAASAFFPSPYQRAAILTMDGVGEWCTSSWGIGSDNHIELKKELRFPHSLGLLYSAITYYTGFKVNSGEYKVMGLAPYGNRESSDRYIKLLKEHVLDICEDGSLRMNQAYFNYSAGLTMTNEKWDALFDGPARVPESNLTQKEMDFALAVQDITEEVMLKMARHVKKETGEKYLCLAGGVALNCVGNGKILKANIFDGIFIQPAAGDAGGALGSALYAWHQVQNNPRKVDNKHDLMQGAYLGPRNTTDEIAAWCDTNGYPYHRIDDETELIKRVAGELANEKVIGWHHGKMEFGPRALGARSIIGDARSSKMQATMNLKIKFRESFRPFAPSVLREDVAEWFELDVDSPYMLLVANVQPAKCRQMTSEEERRWGIEKLNVVRSEIPAITHVDYSARVQTVHKETNPRYHALISEFKRLTGCPVIINTSFNVRGEPIVCTPKDSYTCFMRTDMDVLVLENCVLYKTEQPAFKETADWRKEFQLD